VNRFGKIAVCLAGGLVFTASLRADGPLGITAAAGDPYSPIVDRNVFGLLPPPPPPDPSIIADASLPKITANGIMDVFGNLKVLFKTSGKQGQKDNFYDLAEGQSEDDIEVVKIDENAKMVTFNNHGDEQQIALVTESSSGGGGGNGGGGGGMSGGFGGRPGFNGGGGFNSGGFNGGAGGFNRPGYNGGGQSGFNGGGGQNGGYGGAPGGINVGGSTLSFSGANQYQPQPQPKTSMSAEDQVIMIEAQKVQMQQTGDPTANIMPITPISGLINGNGGDDSQGNGGDNSQ
jgi:hypothetical protein